MKWTNTSTLLEGLIIGAFVGGLISVMTSTYWWGTSHLFNNYKPIIVDFFAAILTVSLMGGAIAMTINLI